MATFVRRWSEYLTVCLATHCKYHSYVQEKKLTSSEMKMLHIMCVTRSLRWSLSIEFESPCTHELIQPRDQTVSGNKRLLDLSIQQKGNRHWVCKKPFLKRYVDDQHDKFANQQCDFGNQRGKFGNQQSIGQSFEDFQTMMITGNRICMLMKRASLLMRRASLSRFFVADGNNKPALYY